MSFYSLLLLPGMALRGDDPSVAGPAGRRAARGRPGEGRGSVRV